MDPGWRRWTLLLCLAALGCGYVAAFALFSSASRDFIVAARDRAALQHGKTHRLPLPASLSFRRGDDGAVHLGDGWHAVEADGVWSNGRTGRLALRTGRCDCALDLTIHAGVPSARGAPANALEVFVDGQPLGRFARGADNAWEPAHVTIPRTLAAHTLDIVLQVDRAQSPFSAGTGADRRVLGLKLISIDVAALPSR